MKSTSASIALLAALAVPAVGCGAETPPPTPWNLETADLVFMSNRTGDAEIYLLRGGSTEWINLTNNPAADNWPEWSPDGTRIAFQSNRDGKLDIWVMDTDGSNQVRLTDDPDHDYLPAWSPDGTKITFTSWRQEPGDTERTNHIYIMNADGSGQRRLFEESPGTSAGVTWSPDGKTFVLDRKIGDQDADVFVLDQDGVVVTRLTDDEAYNGSPVFSPDGSWVAFYSGKEETTSLVIVNVDGSGRRVLVHQGLNWYPRWSPDGRWLVFTAPKTWGDQSDLDIFAVPVDEPGTPVTLVSGPNREAEARWRPHP